MRSFTWRRGQPALALVMLMLMTAGPVAAGAAQARPASSDAVVMTKDGPVRGTATDDYRLYQGIPYAAPPVGDLRWQSPQPVTPWTAPLEATAPGNRCPQAGDPINGPRSEDEDCLYLNVTAPRDTSPTTQKPVLVWFHGGGYVGGAGSDYDARLLAVKGDMVVVTLNYRLGIFGFFAHPELAQSGSYGLQDQQAALRWVQANIAAFGGDPGSVTIGSQSAGGVSVCAHLTSPTAAGLFHRAINQSGGCLGDAPSHTFFPGVTAFETWPALAEIEEIGTMVAPAAGCADPATAVACLRAIPVADLLPASLIFTRPGFGVPLLPESPARAIAEGRFHQAPILSGHTRDEGTMWAGFHPQPITADYYHEQLGIAFGDDAEVVAAEYPLGTYATPGLAWAAVVTDCVWACPAQAELRHYAAVTPTFAFYFDDREAPPAFPGVPEIPLGAYHGAELTYLFGDERFDPSNRLDADQRELSSQMIQYWSNFARSGDPNSPALPTWEPFTTGAPAPYVQRLAPGPAGIGPVDVIAEHRCDFWADLAAAD